MSETQAETYQALPRKYRPKTFDDLVGQKAAARVLIASLKQNRIFPGYIFEGIAKIRAALVLPEPAVPSKM